MPKRPPKARTTQQPVSKSLRGFADARKPANDLLRDVQKHVVAKGIENSGVGRESHKIHVSELIKDVACPRQMYYKITEVVPTDNPEGSYHRLEIIWAAGHQEHAKWQRWLQEMGDLFGSWKCLICDFKWEDVSPQACPECSGELLEYAEVELEVYPLVGHADGAVPRLNCLVEVKSFSVGSVRYDSPKLVAEHTVKVDGKSLVDHEGLWAAVKRPLRSHLFQGLMYLWMCREMGLPYDKIVFIYENKTTQATKTFEITLQQRKIQEFLDILDKVMQHVQVHEAPARPALFSKESKPCNHCVFRTTCWDDDSSSSPAVSVAGSRAGSEAPRRTSAVRSSGETEGLDSRRSRRHHRVERRGSHRDDDGVHEVGRAPGGAGRDGRGGRAVGAGVDGEGTRPRFARRYR